MKTTIILLTLFALTSCGWFGQKKQAEATENGQPAGEKLPAATLEEYGGIYRFGDATDPDSPRGEMYIYPETDSSALVYLYKANPDTLFSSGSILGRIKIRDGGDVLFEKYLGYDDSYCSFYLKLNGDTMTVEDYNYPYDCYCGFGEGVEVRNDTFYRVTSEIPQFYTTVAGEKIRFDRIQKDNGPITLPYDVSLAECDPYYLEYTDLLPGTGLGAMEDIYNYLDYSEDGEPDMRYVKLPSKGGATIILVSRENYSTATLLVIKGGQVTGALYVLGVERDIDWGTLTRTVLTSFAIDEDYRITIRTDDKSPGYRGEPYTTRHWWISGEGELLDIDRYVYEKDWETVRCRQWTEYEGYASMQESIFPGATLAQVYDIVKRIDPYFEAELPESDTQYPADEGNHINVEYRYETSGHLIASVIYEGGTTWLEIEEKEGETHCLITYSHD